MALRRGANGKRIGDSAFPSKPRQAGTNRTRQSRLGALPPDTIVPERSAVTAATLSPIYFAALLRASGLLFLGPVVSESDCAIVAPRLAGRRALDAGQ